MKDFYYTLTLLLPVYIGVVVSQISVETNPQMGDFSTPNGAECMWFNEKSDESKTSLSVACWCKNEEGEKTDYGCHYSAPKKKCDKKTDSFFEGLVDQLNGNIDNVFQSENFLL